MRVAVDDGDDGDAVGKRPVQDRLVDSSEKAPAELLAKLEGSPEAVRACDDGDVGVDTEGSEPAAAWSASGTRAPMTATVTAGVDVARRR
jgi:hypothetical protein